MDPHQVEQERKTTPAHLLPVSFKIQVAKHDENRAYKLSEAIHYGLKYQKAILQQPANPESWFSLYELHKIKAVGPAVEVDRTEFVYTFEHADAAIDFVEKMLRECGYEMTRPENWVHAVYMDVKQMAVDMSLMTSLVIAEHDWEVSVIHYRGEDENYLYHKPRFLVVEDGVYTPQTKPTRARTMSEAILEPEEGDKAMTKSPVKKTLNFADMRSSGSEADAPETPPTQARPKQLKETLLALTASGQLSVEDFTQLVAGLNKKSAAVAKPVRVEKSTGRPSEEARPSRARSSSFGREWASSLEDDLGISARGITDREKRGDSQRHFTTVIQNMTLRSFDGSKTDPEEGRHWLAKFMHNANLAGWMSTQCLDAFADSLTNPAKYWFKQLPSHVRNDWKATLGAFHTRYCTDNVPPMRLYHAMTQKPDESPLNYFYRLNAAATRAKLDIRRKDEDDDSDWSPAPSDLTDHLDFFWDSLHDHAVAERFRFDEYRSLTQVERLLSRRKRTMVKAPKKKEQKKAAVDGGSSEQQPPAVNKVQQGGRDPSHDGAAATIAPYLNPWPPPRSIFALDNAKIHMYKELQSLVHSTGALLFFLISGQNWQKHWGGQVQI